MPCHGIFGKHGSQTEILADVTQEVDDRHGCGPVVVGHETYGIAAFGVQNAADLLLQTLGPNGHHILRIQRAFAGLPRISDKSRGTTDKSDRIMSGRLQMAHVD